jgi:hypothetical protein
MPGRSFVMLDVVASIFDSVCALLAMYARPTSSAIYLPLARLFFPLIYSPLPFSMQGNKVNAINQANKNA